MTYSGAEKHLGGIFDHVPTDQNDEINVYERLMVIYRDHLVRRGILNASLIDFAHRVRGLGLQLCAVRNQYKASTASLVVSKDDIWSRYMNELIEHESTLSDCLNFHEFYQLRWNPLVWQWPKNGWYIIIQIALTDELFKDSEWRTTWGRGILFGVHYAPLPMVPYDFLQLDDGTLLTLRAERT